MKRLPPLIPESLPQKTFAEVGDRSDVSQSNEPSEYEPQAVENEPTPAGDLVEGPSFGHAPDDEHPTEETHAVTPEETPEVTSVKDEQATQLVAETVAPLSHHELLLDEGALPPMPPGLPEPSGEEPELELTGDQEPELNQTGEATPAPEPLGDQTPELNQTGETTPAPEPPGDQTPMPESIADPKSAIASTKKSRSRPKSTTNNENREYFRTNDEINEMADAYLGPAGGVRSESYRLLMLSKEKPIVINPRIPPDQLEFFVAELREWCRVMNQIKYRLATPLPPEPHDPEGTSNVRKWRQEAERRYQQIPELWKTAKALGLFMTNLDAEDIEAFREARPKIQDTLNERRKMAESVTGEAREEAEKKLKVYQAMIRIIEGLGIS